MKRFEFRLEAVLRWRLSELESEQARLQNLFAELAAIRTSIDELDAAQTPERTTVHSPAATPGERVALDCWIRWARAERDSRIAKAADCERRIAGQRARVVEARRKAELLEKLRERRRSEWTAELGRELEAVAAEAYAAKWHR